ncbi:MAG: antibiotic biosynthesis monooxygenase [bacterium]
MFTVVWTYTVPEQHREAFKMHYRENGSWAKLFQKGDGYLHTECYQDADHPERCLTIDRWRSREQYDRFFEQYRDAYLALDKQCEGLTDNEELIATLDE